KLHMIYEIIWGLDNIHRQNLIHCDFHDGNILNHNDEDKVKIYISDLGLCRPVKSLFKKDDIYGVIPFMAPEVLRGKPYTLASDIYSFSMIMWEFTSGVPPFSDREHDLQLSISICKGERPEITENTPQCYVDLMKKCWDEDPLKRPSSQEVLHTI
ncbi:kinase-like domain-containing protein, partial [Rhizophagus diaphanus]